jgi:hypothetical protein
VQNTLDTSLKCVNCKGKHKAFNQRCPLIIKEKEIKKVMANRSVGYADGRRNIKGWTQSWSLIGVHVEPSHDVHNAHTEGTHILIYDNNISRLIPKMIYCIQY